MSSVDVKEGQVEIQPTRRIRSPGQAAVLPYGMNSGKGSKICCRDVKVICVRQPAYNRLFVEAVLYRYRSGILWGDLPERFGDFRVMTRPNAGLFVAVLWLVLKFSRSLLRSIAECS